MHRSRQHPTLRRSFMLLAGLALAVLGLVLFITSDPPSPAAPVGERAVASPAPHFWHSDEQRTIVIAPAGTLYPSRDGVLSTTLVEGRIPSDARHALVLTDTDCVPDQDGVSHCLNRLAIGNEVVVVQHHHRMHDVPCLSPGETVQLMDVSAFKQLAS